MAVRGIIGEFCHQNIIQKCSNKETWIYCYLKRRKTEIRRGANLFTLTIITSRGMLSFLEFDNLCRKGECVSYSESSTKRSIGIWRTGL